MGAPNEIIVDQLLRLVGTPDCPVILDVQIDEDFEAFPFLIPSAVQIPFTSLQDMVQRYGSNKVVVYCQKGLKLSQGVVAWLRSEGISAEFLSGGMAEWAKAKAPMVPYSSIPRSDTGNKVWVTRHRPKIDRIACPWLIRRFVDPDARFLFVAPSQVASVADRFDAVPFDIEGAYWSHRGENSSFDTLLDEFGLRTAPLSRLAEIVRAADTNRPDQVPEAAGLLAVSIGLSRQFKDDQAQLEAGMTIYDALYRWARDGQSETHSWPEEVSK